jgi:hypothetical protein
VLQLLRQKACNACRRMQVQDCAVSARFWAYHRASWSGEHSKAMAAEGTFSGHQCCCSGQQLLPALALLTELSRTSRRIEVRPGATRVLQIQQLSLKVTGRTRPLEDDWVAPLPWNAGEVYLGLRHAARAP